MNRRTYLQLLGASGLTTAIAGCNDSSPSDPSPQFEFRVTDETFQVKRDDDAWEDMLVHGVNLGKAKPGRFPGEAAITHSEYSRWLDGISEMNANVIRTYTLHPPGFYEALSEHNEGKDDPLLVLHGNWMNEELMHERRDAFDPDVVEYHREGMQHIIDAIHGNLSLAPEAGYASGDYEVDVSSYILGYVIGIEWDPEVVYDTDNMHGDDLGEYDGTFLRTEDASPFEHWLAARMDDTATYEYEEYGDLRPLSFTNWPTTDHLDQPAEPHPTEDLSSITSNHIHPTEEFDRGLFATYHVYPYYPDFLNYEPDYVNFVTEDGEESSYRGYLEDLVGANDYPVLIGEFGLPSSRGRTHTHVHGYHQGGHDERTQGEMVVSLYEHIVDADTLGGLVFTWQDEWFKRTWNTMDYMDPERRPFWSDIQTSEQMFGVLTFDPGEDPESLITLSGNREQWDNATTLATADETGPAVTLDDGYDAGRTLTGLEASADLRYLYLRLEYDDLGSAVDWEAMNTLVLLDTIPDQGNTTIPYNTGLETDAGVDFLVHLAGLDDSRVVVDAYYDLFYYFYADQLEMLPQVAYAGEKDTGEFHDIELALNQEITIPSTGETIPFESHDTGALQFGTGDPESADFNSLTDVCVTPSENMIEIRLPWLLLNFGDPSQREVIADFWANDLPMGEYIGERIDHISVTAVTFAPDGDGGATDIASETNITDSLSALDGGELTFDASTRFSWETWYEPTYHERKKQSYDILKAAFGDF